MPLPNILGTRLPYIKVWFLKDVTYPLHTSRFKDRFLSIRNGESLKAVHGAPFKVELDVEVWIPILLVDSSTFFNDLVDLELAGADGVVVGSGGTLATDGALRNCLGYLFGVGVNWEECRS